jgi:hypothetical protein
MNSEMQKRLYEMEVIPPAAVWEKLSVNIDEINSDNPIATKVLNSELIPPQSVWEKINSTINVVEEKQPEKKAILINLKRFAAAAIFFGIVITAWILIKNNNERSAGLAGVEKPIPQNPTNDSNSGTKKNDNQNITNNPIDLPISKGAIASASNNIQSRKNGRNYSVKNNSLVPQSTVQYASLNEPLGKTFNQSIDDLSLVTSDQNYLTMINANGRLVKIPAQLASLAPHLQDKPISEDIYEVMFGEGTYWKETLNEWRKKVASAPGSSGDAFTSLVELLKSVQDK